MLKSAVNKACKGEMGTEIQYIEWWTPEYICWTLDKEVLLKRKNPHWNYDATEPEETVDEYGNAVTAEKDVEGINHFTSPQMPYMFLSIFNLGDQPMDRTSLIGQNLANQDRINKRNRQIDKNVDRMNGGMVVSLGRSGLTQPQAKNVSETLRNGGVVAIPDGAPRDAIDSYAPNSLPADVYNDRVDTRERLRDIFGIRGSSSAGLNTESTVRGKIMNRGTDTDRIGGGVTEYLEQWADGWYNWLLQLAYVYDPAFQFVNGGRPPKLQVSVKEGSLLPKDSTTIANQAIELATAGKMATVDLYKRLEYPNPEELAANVWLENNAPELLYKDNPMVQQAIRMKAQAAAQAAAEEEAKAAVSGQSELENEFAKGQMQHENKMEIEAMKQEGQKVLREVPQGPSG